MDETQKRKISAKEFIEKNQKAGFLIILFFVSLFILFFAFVFVYSHRNDNVDASSSDSSAATEKVGFLESLLPTFSEDDSKKTDLDENFLANFNTGGASFAGQVDSPDGPVNDNSKIIKIEATPVLGYAVFDKPVSVKNYVQYKPKICVEKLISFSEKDIKSNEAKLYQDMLRSTSEFEDTPNTEMLDEKTRDKTYIFQKKYANIIYVGKTDKTPTRVLDPETTHFLNLLCGFEKENTSDFLQVPTLRYVNKTDRQIMDFNTETKQKVKIDSKLATGTQEVFFSPKAEFAAFRKEKDGNILTEFYNIRTKGTIPLEANISSMDFNSKNILVYGVPGENGLIIKSYNPILNTTSKIANIPLNEWNVFWVSDIEVGIYNKPTAFADSIYMVLDLTTKKLRQVAGPLTGLSVQKTNVADLSILSTGGQGTAKTLLLNTKTRNIGDFGISTFAEKCSHTIFAGGIFCAVPKSLSQNFIYPDDWYKNKTRTEDVIIYKTIAGTSTKIISYLENRPLSVLNLDVNKNGIFFIDENTLNLYSLEL
jgi:hypothetical protein